MSRFNTSTLSRTVQVRTPNTTNLAGGTAWAQDPELELASILTTSFVKDQYYRTADDTLVRLIDLLSKVDPYFAAQAAVYARNEDGIRSITHVLAAELVRRVKGEQWTRNFLKAVIRRPDDATEIVAYYLGKYGKPLPNSLKKGVGLALGKFDAYQLAKYRGQGQGLKLVDVVRLTHPTPTERNGDAILRLIKDELRNERTWEAKQSAAGQVESPEERAQAKKQSWEEFLANPAVEYLALLRNLRNIVQGDPALEKRACELLTDPKRVQKALIFPFQYLIALNELRGYPRVVQALSKAVDLSVANVPDLGHALVAVDGSGSMEDKVAGNERLTRKYVGSLFGAVLFKKNLSDVIVFGSHAGRVFLNPADSTLTNAERINQACFGHATNFHAIFEEAGNVKYDTVVIFSDMQAWVRSRSPSFGWYTASDPRESFKQYKIRTGANPKVFAFDLAGYGTAQFPEPDVFQLSGFTDKTIGLMEKYRQDPRALVSAIKQIKF